MIYILTTDPNPIIGDKVYIYGGIGTISYIEIDRWDKNDFIIITKERPNWAYSWKFLQSVREEYRKEFFNIELKKEIE